MNKTICVLISMSILMQGCATSSKKLPTSYISPLQYSQYDCSQLSAETLRIQQRITELGGRLDEAAKNDVMITAVTLVLFWPAVFALGGNKQNEAEFSRLKGEYEAIQRQSVLNKCDIMNVEENDEK